MNSETYDNLGEGFTDHTPKLMMDILKLKKKINITLSERIY